MNMVSQISDEELATTAEEALQLCSDIFEHACRKESAFKTLLHLRQENGRPAKLMRLQDGGELILYKTTNDTFRLGFRAAAEGFKDEEVGRHTVSNEGIEWIAEEVQGKLVCHNESRLLSLKF